MIVTYLQTRTNVGKVVIKILKSRDQDLTR